MGNPTPSDWCIRCHSEALWRKDCEQCADILDLALVKLGGSEHEDKSELECMKERWRHAACPGYPPPSDEYTVAEWGSLGLEYDSALSAAMRILGKDASELPELDRDSSEVRNAMNEMPKYLFA